VSATKRRRGPGDEHAEVLLALAVIGVALGIVVTIWLAAWMAYGVGSGEAPPGNPFMTCVHLATGDYRWPGTTGNVMTGVLMTLYTVPTLLVVWLVRRREVVLVDRAIPYLAKSKDMRSITTQGVVATANQLGLTGISPPGVHIGRTVRGGQDLWGSWEDMHVDIWGPRTGKTATRAIPNIVAAPGACVITSNKRDVVDATRLARERRGKVWVFDPQNQATEPPTWWWNPLSYVRDSIVRAVKLAGRFSSINRPSHARSDAYFEPAAEDLIANLLLAAAISDNYVSQVYTWLTRPNDTTPERILRDAGHHLSADAVEGVYTSPDRQRAGVFGTAQQMVSFLTAPSVLEWVTPGKNPNRPEFDYMDFIRRGEDTIYLLSEETNKMAAPLVLALTVALAEDAENTGIASPGGRLPKPMLFVLDEAANVCPWKALPDKYSHFGSRGLVMMTILQSWSQGAAVWGEVGMAKLWGAANVRVYGGGVVDMKFLSDLSKASGTFEPLTTATSRKTTELWGGTVNRGSRPEAVLDEADLASMPRGRVFLQCSGMPPMVARTVPWWEGPYADVIRESIATYDPGAKSIPAPVAMAASTPAGKP
jgi:type IV secretory pathway TraG/TraD family ATPase VirD4